MIDVASAGPVGAGLDRDAHILDPSILRAHLRLVQRPRVLAVESVQTLFHEVLLVGARHEWESAAYEDQFDFVDRMTHSSELTKSAFDLEIGVVAGFKSSHNCWLFARVGPGHPFIGSTRAVCAFSMRTAVRFRHHRNSCNAAEATDLFVDQEWPQLGEKRFGD